MGGRWTTTTHFPIDSDNILTLKHDFCHVNFKNPREKFFCYVNISLVYQFPQPQRYIRPPLYIGKARARSALLITKPRNQCD